MIQSGGSVHMAQPKPNVISKVLMCYALGQSHPQLVLLSESLLGEVKGHSRFTLCQRLDNHSADQRTPWRRWLLQCDKASQVD